MIVFLFYNIIMEKDFIVFVADGFEDVELIATLDVFSRNDLTYDLFSVENKNLAKGKYNAQVETHKMDNLNVRNYKALFIPGGPGYKTLLASGELRDIIKAFDYDKKIIGAICAAPEVLKQTGILEGRSFTSFPGTADSSSNTQNDIEVDDNIITGKNFSITIEFAKELVKQYKKTS